MLRRFSLALFVVGFALLMSSPALAQLTQPDGTTIPQGSNLQDIFNARGESLNAINDASLVPEIFTPSSSLTFTLVAEGAGLQLELGELGQELCAQRFVAER